MRKLICMGIAPAMLTAGCFGAGVPACNDNDVKGLVLDISTTEMRNQVMFTAMRQLGISAVGRPTYEEWNKFRDKDEATKRVLDLVDKMMAESKMTLVAIRTNSTHKDSKKSACGGELNFPNGYKLPITYIAQRTEDRKIYVEVSGLRQ